MFAAAGMVLGGALLVDPAAIAKLPWSGLVPPDGASATQAPAQPSQGSAGGTGQVPEVDLADRGTRPLAMAPGSAAPVLSLPGPFPSSGPGTFVFATTRGPAMGTAGTLRRFQVGIEKGVDEDLDALAAKIDQTLGDPRSWTAGGQLQLQRVSPAESPDFTIYLATAETARRMCAQGNVNIVEQGKAYTSCRAAGKVILNLDRWRLSVPEYAANRVPLEIYREYLINHEVGHELGHGHELCPGKGQPAPVMQQQTLGLYGCTANPWPYLNGKRYAGPPGSYDDSSG